jgi:iron complex transport system substrate-binding protein
MVSGGISKSDYQTLSKICPVVGPPVGYQDYAVPYGPHTELIGRCVGKPSEAAEAVARLDDAYEAARAANPDWSEMTSIHAECYTGTFYVLGENAPRSSFLTSLGFRLSPELSEIVGEDYSKEISAEELEVVGDLDLVVWCTDAGAIPDVQANPVVSRLESVRDGNAIWISGAKTDEFMWAMDWSTVLSGAYAIEHGVPLIKTALAGGSPLAESDA